MNENVEHIDKEAEQRRFEIMRVMLPIVWRETESPSMRGKVKDAVERAAEIADAVELKLKGETK